MIGWLDASLVASSVGFAELFVLKYSESFVMFCGIFTGSNDVCADSEAWSFDRFV